MGAKLYLGIDVGTGSARAGVFDETGKMHGMGTAPIQTWRPADDFVEQSSDDIWQASCLAVRQALGEAKATPDRIAGIGFDATCSLVVLGPDDRPVTVSPTGAAAQNVIVWMDHRAIPQAQAINKTGHEVLRYVGGVISPEMETPKLLWLKEKMPATWARAKRFFDLPDFLVYRATGTDARSLCTTVCKWTYRGDVGRWDETFFREVGLEDLANEQFVRIGTKVRPMGEKAGALTEKAAKELGLVPGIPVGVAIIDAHAGGVGMLGATIDGRAPGNAGELEQRLALIGGTSSCHMAVSQKPKFIPGIWGPYFSAMVPGMWLTEGGQSATGALLEYVVASHARGPELADEAKKAGTSVFELLNRRVAALAAAEPGGELGLTREVHVLPDHHGNRSPRADPTLKGVVTGLSLSTTTDALAVQYLATIQAIAYGTRHILDEMNRAGYAISAIIACGGDTKNALFVANHADATGCRIVLPAEPEAVLLGSAMLGAVASGDRATVAEAMAAMSRAGRVVEPDPRRRVYHDAKYKVFHRMHTDQMLYRTLMEGAS
jgi:FGGY-family pentulose kinase